MKKVLSKNMDECSVQHGRIPKMSNSVSIFLQRIHLNYNESIEMCFGIIEEVHIYTKICLVKYKNHLIEPVRTDRTANLSEEVSCTHQNIKL